MNSSIKIDNVDLSELRLNFLNEAATWGLSEEEANRLFQEAELEFDALSNENQQFTVSATGICGECTTTDSKTGKWTYSLSLNKWICAPCNG